MKGLFRRTRLVVAALGATRLDRGATFGESAQFLRDEVGLFVRQGHAHRLPQLLACEFTRWAGRQAGRRGALNSF